MHNILVKKNSHTYSIHNVYAKSGIPLKDHTKLIFTFIALHVKQFLIPSQPGCETFRADP